MAKLVILIHDTDEDQWKDASADEKQHVYDTDMEFGKLLMERGGKFTGGAELTHSREARVVRREGAVTEGPFAESVEVLSGFFMVDGVERDDIVELAEVLTRVHDVVEVRPIASDGE